MKTKTITSLLTAGILTFGTISGVSANALQTNNTLSTNTPKQVLQDGNKPPLRKHFGKFISEEEKAKLENMTQEQRQAFFKAKGDEIKAKRDAKKTIVDKLLAGTQLTTEENTILEEIKKERAERFAKAEEKRKIMDKLFAKQSLSTEEKAKVENFRENKQELKIQKQEKKQLKKDNRLNRRFKSIVTPEEMEALKTMTKEQRKEFIQTRKEELKAIVKKYKAGETLSETEKAKIEELKRLARLKK